MDPNPRDCILCFTAFGDEELQTPRSLPCGHTFCYDCCGKLLNGVPGQVRCPSCRKTSSFSRAADIPKNYLLLAVLNEEASIGARAADGDGKEEEGACGYCKRAAASVHCSKCEVDYCERCVSAIHKAGLAAHQTVPVAEKPQPEPRCHEHGERLCFWCDSCRHVICFLCKEEGGAHYGHASRFASAVVPVWRDEMEAGKALVAASLEDLAKHEKKIAKATVSIASSARAAGEEVDAAASRLRAAIDARHAELRRQLSEHAQQRQDELDRALASIQSLKASAAAAGEEANTLTAGPDAALLQWAPVTQDWLLDVGEKTLAAVDAPLALEAVCCQLPLVDDLVEQLSRLGHVGVAPLAPPPGASKANDDKKKAAAAAAENGNDEKWRQDLAAGDAIDALDTEGVWRAARVVRTKDAYLHVHYNGWEESWDEWLDRGGVRVARFRTHTSEVQAAAPGDDVAAAAAGDAVAAP